jgi:hypothetical protein
VFVINCEKDHQFYGHIVQCTIPDSTAIPPDDRLVAETIDELLDIYLYYKSKKSSLKFVNWLGMNGYFVKGGYGAGESQVQNSQDFSL